MNVAPIDLTQIIIAIALSSISIVGTVGAALISSHIKNKQMADALNLTLSNGLGAMQQAVQSGLSVHPLQVQLPHITAPMAAGVQYVLNNAPAEMAHFGITKEMVVDKLDARLGLKNIETNVAQAASPGPTPQPLSPIPNPSSATQKV